MLVRIVKETLSVARFQSRVGGSFFMDMRKTDSSVGEDGLQPMRIKVRSKIATGNQKEKTVFFNFMMIVSFYLLKKDPEYEALL